MLDGEVQAIVDGMQYSYKLSEIEQVMLITTELGPFLDDMCLAIRIDDETAIFIMSEHQSYNHFLFDQLGKAISLDYEEIIKASTCTENNIFLIYKRK